MRDIDTWIEQILSAYYGRKPLTKRDLNFCILEVVKKNYQRWYRSLKKEYNTLSELNSDEQVEQEVFLILSKLIDLIDTDEFNTIERLVQQ